MELSPEQLKQSRFEAVLQNDFTVTSEFVAGEYPFKLTSLKSRPAPKGYEQYSLLFLGPVEPQMPQGIYHYQHDTLGTLPLFTVPVGKSAAGVEYEVCVSRLTDND